MPGAAAPAAAPATPEQLGTVPGISRRRVVGYFMGTGVLRGVDPQRIRGDRLTHLIYAFADIGPDGLARLENPCIDIGQCAPGQRNPYPDGGVFGQLRQLKQRYPHLKLLISVGGWGRSSHFSDAAATPESRKAFIESAMELLFRRYPGLFDGLDLDWEFPVRGGMATNSYRPDDRANFTALVEELRQRLDLDGAAAHTHYLLTEASPAGAGHMVNQDLARLATSLDFFNIMCYDYHSGGRMAHFNAPLFSPAGDPTPNYNVDWTVRAYLALGIPSYKLVVGVPFYGVGYAGVPGNRGLFQPVVRDTTAPATVNPAAPALTAVPTPASTPAPTPAPATVNPVTPTPAAAPTPVAALTSTAAAAAAPTPAPAADARPQQPWGASGFRYPQLKEAQQRGFKRYWHPEAKTYWLHHADSGVFVSYEDPRALKHKSDYIRRHDLGGIMFWEIGADTTGTLLEAAWKGMRK
jgi:chitinase